MVVRRARLVVALRLMCVMALLSVAGSAGATTYFADDLESGLGNWSADAPWGATTAFYASPVSSVTDSPSTFYGTNVDASLTMTVAANLSSATRPVLRFRHRHQLEDGYDFAYVEVSTNGGSTWSSPQATFTGGLGTWGREQVDLSAFVGQADVRVRFRLVTDGTVVADGWYIDDVVIADAPAPVSLDPPSGVATNSLDLSWSASAAPDFAAYRIYRSLTPAFDWRTATLVSEITSSATVTHSDITVTPKTTYHYQVMVLTTEDLHSLSNEQSATTPSGMTYPFLDDAEGSGTAWTADPPWAMSTEASYSGSSAWSDSPGGNYADGITSQSLTLVSPLDLSSATAPVLSFIHTWDFLSGDSGIVEASTDGGTTWTPLLTRTNSTSTGWQRERIDLASYVGQSSVLLRFRITTSPSDGADGWHVDDISVAESPTVVDAPIIDQVTANAMRLTWARCHDLLFSHYAIHRSTTTGVGIQDELVTEIHDQDTVTFDDSGLLFDTDYFYRVYAVSPYLTYSPDGTENNQLTLGNPYPFAEDFEGSLENWEVTGDWGVTDTDQHAGTYSITDSPGTTYPNSVATWIQTTIDLSESVWPVLSFWDRHAFAGQGSDWAGVEISADGSSWARVYDTTGDRDDWTLQQVDLSPWRGETSVRVRFFFFTSSTNVDDGWYIDDVAIDEYSGETVPLPFAEDFETGLGNWLSSGWGRTESDPHGGSWTGQASPNRYILDGSEHVIELGGVLDLAAAVDPQLTYWIRGTVGYRGRFDVQYSLDAGETWLNLAGTSAGSSVAFPSWTRVQVPMADLLQDGVRLRFRSGQSIGNTRIHELFVDDVSIEELPSTVILAPPTPSTTTVDLSWSQSSLGGDFGRYEVYRATHATVTTADELVFSSTDIADTTASDTGLIPGDTYYYKVFVFNRRNVASPSNEQPVVTTPLSLPFVDPMEDMDNWWTSGGWGPDDDAPAEGSYSLSDSPGAVTPPSDTLELRTAVDLTAATWPVLRFRDRLAMADDWAIVEVSTTGSSWTKIYGATGTRSTWQLQQIDLSPYIGNPSLRIRFKVSTGSANQGDGWFVDDLRVADFVGSMPLPFIEDFESGTARWLNSQWTETTADAHAGTASLQSTPQGAIVDRNQHVAEIAGEFDLSGTTDPQFTYWVKGVIASQGSFAAQISNNGGQTWNSLPGTTLNQQVVADWTRFQVSLDSFLQPGIRLRFLAKQGNSAGATDILVDDVSVEEVPAGVNLAIPVPSLKSVDLSWSQSSLGGDYDRYEVYRDTSPDVTTDDTLIASFTSVGDTTFTDTGLSIGQTYYYKVFTFNTRGVAGPSNERTTTTVPLSMPFVDPMENLDFWDTNGAWGPDGASPHQGAASLNDSPGGNSSPSSETYILTAIDLTGSTWPVLRFWDRFAMADDWGVVEVSPNGSSWTKLYSAFVGSRTTWTEQAIDLSPWKTEPNLRIRFRVVTNGSTVDEGWFIDRLSVTNQSGAVALPFVEDFETDMDSWLSSGWERVSNDPHGGSWQAQCNPQGSIVDRTKHVLQWHGEFDLSAATSPQLTYWLRGVIVSSGSFGVEVSTDGGANWSNVSGSTLSSQTLADWTRFQIPLTDYLQAGVRLRFRVSQGSSGGATSLQVDDVSIQEMPTPVVLETPDQVTTGSLRLQWNNLSSPDFVAYAVYRSETSAVDTTSELVATITDQATTDFTDTGLDTRREYFYRVYFVDTLDTHSGSNSVSAVTEGVSVPFTDDFETDTGVWNLNGQWGRLAAAGIGGGTSFADSPGDFTPNDRNWAVTGVDLTSMNWPVLRFSDRFSIPSSHWGYLELSTNGGGSWTILYAPNGEQLDWVERRFDLSPWKDQDRVLIRFRLAASSSSTVGDGWHVDNLYLGENQVTKSPGHPFFEGFENGAGDWLNGSWTLTDDTPFQGATAILDTTGARAASSELTLVYAGALDLSAATEPILTVHCRGNLSSYNYFKAEVSTDGGLTWQNLPDLYLSQHWSSSWVRLQTSLSGYLVSNLRLRFRVYGSGGGDSNVFLDNVAVGEETPGAPTLNAPAMGADELVIRPQLVVNNAVDYQSDVLDYEFQVFDDAGLTNQVAQVPAVAGGIDTTAWTLDVDLETDTQYWWRCRATDDGGNTGDWMATATFFVQLEDHPPTVPVLVAPSDGGTLGDLAGRLTWLESTDPDADAGDFVDSYRVQVDDDPAFGSPEIDVPGISNNRRAAGAISVTLAELPDSGGLVSGTLYYWRVNAKDSEGVSSDWSAGPTRFLFGTDATAPDCGIVSPVDDATLNGIPIAVTGIATDDVSGVDMVEISTDGGTSWTQVVGADAWSHQWWPLLSGDYQLSCRATDVAGNTGTPSTPITIHAQLDRVVAFATTTASVDETTSSIDVEVSLDAMRATEVSAQIQVSGTASAGHDFSGVPNQITFYPGQTTLTFTVTILDDAVGEGNESIVLQLNSPNLGDITFGAGGIQTITIVDDEPLDPFIFADGFDDGTTNAWN
jgi:hypothetical protein